MAEFNEQQEQANDQAFLDGFNTAYEIVSKANDKKLDEKERKTYQALAKALNGVDGKSDRVQGLKAGKEQYAHEQRKQKLLDKKKDRSKDRGGYSR
ncbi:MAG: hypothetical protein Roseis2KO_53800 [Roseivirga sp.]